jgi:hypothetical protein
MSLLPATSHANPSTPFWSTSGGGGGGGGQVVAYTSADVVVNLTNAFTEYVGLTYVGSGNGTYVITAYFQCNPEGNTPGVFYGAIGLNPSGLSAGCQQACAGGYESMSCCLTVPNVNGIDIKVVTQSSIAGSQVKFQWNVLFFPA